MQDFTKGNVKSNDAAFVNTSGMGKDAVIPDGVKGWSWGAFFLGWIWAIGNRTWIGLLCLIPYVGFVMAILLASKGREWAWRNKRWNSVAHFNEVQRKWSFWGVIFVVAVFGILFAIAIHSYDNYKHKAQPIITT
jgi:hypothetical protein